MSMNRRQMMRVVAPAVALPLVPADVLAANQVTREEIKEAFMFFDFQEMKAEDFNLRFQILVDLLFETNPNKLRGQLDRLRELRTEADFLVDVDTGRTETYAEWLARQQSE